MDPKQIEEIRTKLKDAGCHGVLALIDRNLQMQTEGKAPSQIIAVRNDMSSEFIGAAGMVTLDAIVWGVDDLLRLPEPEKSQLNERWQALADSLGRMSKYFPSSDSSIP